MTRQLRRQWCQFTLRGLFVVLTILCVGPGAFVASSRQKAENQRRRLEAFERLGATITYSVSPARQPTLTQHLFGNDPSRLVSQVSFPSSASITDVELAGLQGFSEVKRLCLDGTNVTDAGLVHLKVLTKLEYLSMESTRISDDGLAHVVPLVHLHTIDLENSQVSDDGIGFLTMLPELHELDLAGTHVGDRGIQELAKAPHLRILDLSRTKITNVSLVHLSKAKELVYLDIGETAAHRTPERQLSGMDLLWFLF